MLSIIHFFAVALFVMTCSAAALADAPGSIDGATTVDAKGVINLVETVKDLVVLDNRHEPDYAAGHIEGAVRLLDTDIADESVLAKVIPTKTTPVLFYCNGLKCGRAANAATKAVGWGYKTVYYYALGMTEWKEQGLPLSK